jgi:hypothetical protein
VGRRARAVVATLGVGMIGLTAALAPAVGDAAGGEAPVTVKVGDETPADFDVGISPTLLPPNEPAATEFRLSVEEHPRFFGDGVPPGITEARFGFDRSIDLEPHGPPVCRWPTVESGIQIDAAGNSDCPSAVVGRAEATIEFAFAETMPINVMSRGKVYNGGTRRGATDLLVELPVTAPLDSTVRLIVPVRPVRRGRIGSEAAFTAPILAGGSGFFLSLKLDLKRGFRDQDGERGGYVNAECRDGKLAATFAAAFNDGTQYAQESVRACSSR